MVLGGGGQFSDSNGNRVYVGNFDSNGFNVNNYSPDNSNDNLRVVLLRQFSLENQMLPALGAFDFLSFFRRFFGKFYPAAQHPADFIYIRLKQKIIFIGYSFYFFGKTNKNS